MSRIIFTDRCSGLYGHNFSFFIGFSVSSFIYVFLSSFIPDRSSFLSSLKDFQFIYPLFTIENAF